MDSTTDVVFPPRSFTLRCGSATKHGMNRPRAYVRWSYRTPPLRALDLDFAVRTNDGVLGGYLDRVFRGYAAEAARAAGGMAATEARAPLEMAAARAAGHPPRLYSVVARADAGGEVWLDEDLLHRTPEPTELVSFLLWHVNRQVVASSSSRHLLVHAAAAEHDGVALVFPAAMESGKTTLVAGLVQRGLRYVTDEAVAVELATRRVRPFPKALSIDPGSWAVVPALRPELRPGEQRFVRGQWHVDPEVAVGPGATATDPSIPGFLVGVSYVAGGTSALAPLARSEAVGLVARNSFNFHALGRAGLEAAADLVRRCRCHRLEMADLNQACDLILSLLDR